MNTGNATIPPGLDEGTMRDIVACALRAGGVRNPRLPPFETAKHEDRDRHYEDA